MPISSQAFLSAINPYKSRLAARAIEGLAIGAPAAAYGFSTGDEYYQDARLGRGITHGLGGVLAGLALSKGIRTGRLKHLQGKYMSDLSSRGITQKERDAVHKLQDVTNKLKELKIEVEARAPTIAEEMRQANKEILKQKGAIEIADEAFLSHKNELNAIEEEIKRAKEWTKKWNQSEEAIAKYTKKGPVNEKEKKSLEWAQNFQKNQGHLRAEPTPNNPAGPYHPGKMILDGMQRNRLKQNIATINQDRLNSQRFMRDTENLLAEKIIKARTWEQAQTNQQLSLMEERTRLPIMKLRIDPQGRYKDRFSLIKETLLSTPNKTVQDIYGPRLSGSFELSPFGLMKAPSYTLPPSPLPL